MSTRGRSTDIQCALERHDRAVDPVVDRSAYGDGFSQRTEAAAVERHRDGRLGDCGVAPRSGAGRRECGSDPDQDRRQSDDSGGDDDPAGCPRRLPRTRAGAAFLAFALNHRLPSGTDS